ncbi:hypothetical protein HAX54_004282 [Datura stramonium]|uniref:Uncharacterized protein n=1 Tax=Datura stramonium TaxID=4076 RepID=A0ABS8T7G3_DATST|nr:hypothetical protein [Datura stramonium]
MAKHVPCRMTAYRDQACHASKWEQSMLCSAKRLWHGERVSCGVVVCHQLAYPVEYCDGGVRNKPCHANHLTRNTPYPACSAPRPRRVTEIIWRAHQCDMEWITSAKIPFLL